MRGAFALAALAVAGLAAGAPITPGDLAALCAEAEDQAHCGRLVEARRMKQVSRIVERNGDELRVSLAPFGLSVFRDSVNLSGARSYAVWDYIEPLDTVVLFTTQGDRSGFLLVQRHGGAEYPLPSEPVIAPDLRHFVTADFCDRDCDNEVALWRIDRTAVRREARFVPPERWSEVSVGWSGSDAVAIEYSVPNDPRPRTMVKRIGDPAWKTIPPRG